ncbi:MAG: OsmC family protein [Pseudomonadota bacterium]
MAENQTLKTTLTFDGSSTLSMCEGHPDIAMTGLTDIDAKKPCWSPPHIFVSSVESCFWLTLLAIADKMRIKIKSFSSHAQGLLESPDGQHKEFTKITIHPKIEFENPEDVKKRDLLFKKAEEHCLVARSIKTSIEVIPQ